MGANLSSDEPIIQRNSSTETTEWNWSVAELMISNLTNHLWISHSQFISRQHHPSLSRMRSLLVLSYSVSVFTLLPLLSLLPSYLVSICFWFSLLLPKSVCLFLFVSRDALLRKTINLVLYFIVDRRTKQGPIGLDGPKGEPVSLKKIFRIKRFFGQWKA